MISGYVPMKSTEGKFFTNEVVKSLLRVHLISRKDENCQTNIKYLIIIETQIKQKKKINKGSRSIRAHEKSHHHI